MGDLDSIFEIKKAPKADWGAPFAKAKTEKLFELFATSGMTETEAEQKVQGLKDETPVDSPKKN